MIDDFIEGPDESCDFTIHWKQELDGELLLVTNEDMAYDDGKKLREIIHKTHEYHHLTKKDLKKSFNLKDSSITKPWFDFLGQRIELWMYDDCDCNYDGDTPILYMGHFPMHVYTLCKKFMEDYSLEILMAETTNKYLKKEYEFKVQPIKRLKQELSSKWTQMTGKRIDSIRNEIREREEYNKTLNYRELPIYKDSLMRIANNIQIIDIWINLRKQDADKFCHGWQGPVD